MISKLEKDRSRPFLTLDQIAIRLRDRFVFEDTSWQIKSNEQWAIIGPNGAGKSTLVKALAGDLPIVRGRAAYHFLDELGLSDSACGGHVVRVAFDTERDFYSAKSDVDSFSSEQDGEVTVAETILSGGPPGKKNEENRLREIAQKLRMEHLLGRAGHVLSNGEAKKVLIARALLQSPSLLILDEPCDGLDYANRRRVLEFIEFIGSKTATDLIYVTHHKDELPPCITHALVLDNGKVAAVGERKRVLGGLMMDGFPGQVQGGPGR